jgi:hypothetical protein
MAAHEGREITVHVFCFNLYVSPERAEKGVDNSSVQSTLSDVPTTRSGVAMRP